LPLLAWLVPATVCLRTKFEVSNFISSEHRRGVPHFKIVSRDRDDVPFSIAIVQICTDSFLRHFFLDAKFYASVTVV